MVFYPDNEKRASRLQQLVDSMANMQTDVKRISQKMDHDNDKYRPAINELLKANGMDSVDDVINKAAAQMTPEERKAFEALIKTAKATKTGFNTTYFVAALLIAPEGAILTGKVAINIARWATRIVNVNAIATFFRAAESGTAAAAAAAAEQIAAEAEEAEKILQEAGEAGEEIGTAVTWLGRIGTFFKVLGAVGLVISAIAALIEIIEGAEQKEKLIEAIHGLQPSRLTTAFLKQEGMSIVAQLNLLDSYLDTAPGGKHPDPVIAAYMSKKIVANITEENKLIDLSALERDLEVQDRTSTLFYGDDDLSFVEVIAAASKT